MSKFKKIYIEITNNCNFNCEFCSKDNRIKKEMSVDDFEYVINEVKQYTKYIYLHVKGEPLLHSKFQNIIEICEQNKINVNITTNGSLLVKQKVILKSDSIRQINISLQSYKQYNNIEELINTVDYLSNNKSIVYRFWALDNYKLTDYNKKILDIILNHYGKELTKERNMELSKNIYLNRNELFEWPNLNSKEYSNGYCLGTISHIGILVDGTVIPCCLDSAGIVNLGNIFKKSLHDIVCSDKFIKINSEFKNNRCSEELCLHCKYKNIFKKI